MDTLVKSLMLRGMDNDLVNKVMQNSYEKFVASFNSKDYDPVINYEFFEQLGDLSINKFIVMYMGRRFPHLRGSNGVGILATLRIFYGSKDILSELCVKHQLDKFINCTQKERVDKNKYKSILEDVFEAFFGAVEDSVDEIRIGMGFICVYNILSSIFDEIKIDIDYEKLVDAKTRLNELKDEYKLDIKYTNQKTTDELFKSELYLNNKLIGSATSNFKKNAQVLAAQQGLDWININMGITKEIPDRFKNISNKIW